MSLAWQKFHNNWGSCFAITLLGGIFSRSWHDSVKTEAAANQLWKNSCFLICSNFIFDECSFTKQERNCKTWAMHDRESYGATQQDHLNNLSQMHVWKWSFRGFCHERQSKHFDLRKHRLIKPFNQMAPPPPLANWIKTQIDEREKVSLPESIGDCVFVRRKP